MKKHLLLLVAVWVTPLLFAQQLEWKAGLYHFFDNTEFQGSRYIADQTMAGVRVMPEIGWGVEGNHHVRVGLDALKSYGTRSVMDTCSVTAYYLYDNGRFRFCMGSFSREDQLDEFPRAFFQDSIRYYRSTMNGFLVAYRGDNFHWKAFLDWTGKQAETVHEAFFVGASADYHPSIFFGEVQGYMFHYAGSLQAKGVRDNVLLHPALGVNLAGSTWLDTLRVSVGALVGMERNRLLRPDFSVRKGLLVDLNAGYKGVGLHATSYLGQGLMIDYASMNGALYWGDPLYRGRSYTRADVFYDVAKLPYVRARINFANHFSEGKYYVEQSLIVRVCLDSNAKRVYGKK
jgi:hypothetical protein